MDRSIQYNQKTFSLIDKYEQRFVQVIEYITEHLTSKEHLTLARLSEAACFSQYHFHRQFSAFFGISATKYIQLMRLSRAAHWLAYRKSLSILDIALNIGFESPEAFSRAFHKQFEQSPSAFRKQANWVTWQKLETKLTTIRTHTMNRIHSKQVTVEHFEAVPIALMDHKGSAMHLGKTIQQFISWRQSHGLSPSKSRTFNLAYMDPDTVPDEAFRFGLACEIPENFESTHLRDAHSDYELIFSAIPQCRCARLRHIGSDAGLGRVVNYLYRQWLPESGEELRDFPLFFERIRFFPDVPEQDAITEIFLPLRS